MASSSIRSTFVETTIRAHFKWVYWRIHANDASRELQLLTQRFADTLDMDYWQLIDTLEPPHNVSDPEKRRLVVGDIEFWQKAKGHFRNLKESTNIWEAAARCADVAAQLFRHGRDEEAREWCDMVEEMQRWAGEVVWEEKKWEEEQGLRG